MQAGLGLSTIDNPPDGPMQDALAIRAFGLFPNLHARCI